MSSRPNDPIWEVFGPAAIDRIYGEDPAVWKYIVSTYTDPLFRVVDQTVRNRTNSEEIVQLTFIAAFKYRKGFLGNSTVWTWLFAIANNQRNDWFRRQRRQKNLLVHAAQLTPSIPSDDRPDERCTVTRLAESFISRLSINDQMILRMYAARFQVCEIAKYLVIDPETVSTRKHQLLARLRRILKEHGGQP
jgi:RNA polymerase sigma-70 factor (ECF subfamily)